MVAPRHLENAPIKEALIDLQVVLGDEVKTEDLDSQYQAIKDDYPKKTEIRSGTVTIGKGLSGTKVQEELVGFKYSSEDKTRVVQFRHSGFTFSYLEPYTEWEKMKAEAERLWIYYVNAAKPLSIIRVATRYINLIKVPTPIADFQDYLVAPPIVPENLPQGVTSFLSRIVIYKPEINANAIITQALETVDNKQAPITLDIDVFVNREISLDNHEFWECLDNLRDFKNQIFFESITKKTLELFQ